MDPRVQWDQQELNFTLHVAKMPQNVPKMTPNDQNAFNMRVAPKGCLVGTWKAKFALKRVSRDPFRSNLVRF